ncbi:FAD-binding oxidoreductase [Streptomyces sp. NPDC048182]|uniref:FAD-binding oxidoreductase n=1 Tax=Streptomyces sp. NPDC048182 TaxID=3365507 RepID=UPI0037211A2E
MTQHDAYENAAAKAPPSLDALADRVQGPVLRPGTEEYDREQNGFQQAFRNDPVAVVGATGPGDVRAAVEYAAAHGLPVALQATGHGLASVTERPLLVSTRRMTGVTVDPAARTARIEAGVRWEGVIEAAAPHGLAPLSGSAPNVGAISYLLGGGLGVLAREFGYAADHVRSVDLVTAEGRARHVTADSDPDLFWALRGAGANFGAVTAVEVDLVPVASVQGGGLHFDADLVPDVLRAFTAWSATLPDELTASVSVLEYPDIPPMPEPLRGKYAAHVRFAYTGDAATLERLLKPLRDVGPRLIDDVGEIPYTESGRIYADPPVPHAYFGSNVLLDRLDADALVAAAEAGGPGAPAGAVIDVRQLGGALRRRPEVPSAIGHRDAAYILRVLSALDERGADAVRPVHEAVYAAVADATVGRRVNFIYGDRTTTEQVRDAYEPADYRRLRELKRRYDPENLFRCTYNIPPAG